MTETKSAHLRAEIADSCRSISLHAKGIATDVESITHLPEYEVPLLDTLKQTEIDLEAALKVVRATRGIVSEGFAKQEA